MHMSAMSAYVVVDSDVMTSDPCRQASFPRTGWTPRIIVSMTKLGGARQQFEQKYGILIAQSRSRNCSVKKANVHMSKLLPYA
jgi:hypothetical protein